MLSRCEKMNVSCEDSPNELNLQESHIFARIANLIPFPEID